MEGTPEGKDTPRQHEGIAQMANASKTKARPLGRIPGEGRTYCRKLRSFWLIPEPPDSYYNRVRALGSALTHQMIADSFLSPVTGDAVQRQRVSAVMRGRESCSWPLLRHIDAEVRRAERARAEEDRQDG